MSDRIEVRVDPDLEDLVPGFLDNRRKDVSRLEALGAAGDFDGIKRIGHSMKGVGGGYGFDEITNIGAAVEAAAAGGDAAAVAAACARLRDYLERVDVVYDA